MKLKTYSHVQAFIQGTIWFMAGWAMAQGAAFPPLSVDGKISPLAAALFMTIGAFFSGTFACIGAISGARNDYLKGKLKVEDADIESAKALGSPQNPWIVALKKGAVQWPIFVAIGFAMCYIIFPNGLPPKAFGLFTAHLFCVHGAILSRKNCTVELRKFIANPAPTPIPFNRYMITEHLIGTGIANLLINGLFGYVLFQSRTITQCGLTAISGDLVVADVFIMNLIVGVLVPIGASMQAAPDFKTGRAGRPAKILPYPNMAFQMLLYVLAAALMSYAVKYLFVMFGFTYLLISQAIVLKAFIGGGVAVLTASLAVKWRSFEKPPAPTTTASGN